ncbi:MAG: histidine kinase, partial [Flavobacteriales bacterium]|nr:histidine kinase [Flavobacteriales bacterium]
VDTLGQHTFRPAENHISFSFGSIWLTAPGDVSYEYMLEGYNSEWTATRDQFVAFPQLGPGDYRFRVRSIVGNRTGSESTYSFTIAAPYWTKGWFIALVIIGITGLGTYLIRLRISALRKRDAIAKERLQSQFDTLRNQVNPHFLFNSFNTLTAVIEKDQALAVDYVGKLSDFFRTILQQQNKEVITLSEELELLNTYFYLQRQRFGDNLQMQIDIPEAWMNAAIPPLTLQLLAENAIKHNVIARHKPLIIKLYGENETLVFRNNLQEKTVREKSTGIGLQNILNRYKILFKAEVVVEKSEAFFTVRLPLLNLMHER